MSEGKAALLVGAIAGVLLAVAVALPSSGVQPYGDVAIEKQLAREDSAVCTKLGFATADKGSVRCADELTNLRQRSERVLIANGWF